MFLPRSRPGRPRGLERAVGVTAASAALLAGLVAAPAAQGSTDIRSHVRVVAPGVALTTYVDRRVSLHAYMLWIDPSQGASIAPEIAGGRIGDLERTSTIARDNGAIAAVNGDFGGLSDRPIHAFASNGDLVQTSPVRGALFSISADGSMRIGQPTQQVSITEVDAGETWPIATWNHGGPAAGELAAYTSAGGGTEAPRAFTCSARLLPSGAPAPTPDGTTRIYRVDEVGCFSNRIDPGEGVVISAVPASDEATFIRSLTPGELTHVDWSLGWPGVTDAIGGSHVLVSGGKVVLGSCSGAICAPNPRTGIGLTADGRIVLVVIDGRRSGAAGMTLQAFAAFMQRLGVVEAMNLDGGGSSTMVIKGGVANSPSDGFERSVPSAIVVRTHA